MPITGIITEYNPFHNGHLYHLKQAQKLNTDAVICIMNGNFMQRGQPAITDKWARTRMALENGVDLVLELPLIYGIRSAEYFAEGAILSLAQTGIVNSIIFGSETGKLKILESLADILIKEPKFFQKKLKKNLNQGLPFPQAREKAIIKYINFKKKNLNMENIKKILSKPNNILAIEYLKALNKHHLKIKPFTIKRKGSDYHSEKIRGKISSATAIRKIIYSNEKNFREILNLVPHSVYKILKNEIKKEKIPIKKEHLGIMILTKLRQILPSRLDDFAEMGDGLGNRIIELAFKSGTLKTLTSKIKTRAFTWTRIQRNLLHILFNLTKEDFTILDSSGPQYLRVLGFNKTGENLLSKIKQNSSLPIITQPADILQTINIKSKDPLIKQLSYDLIASDIYSLLYVNPEQRRGHLDFYKPVIKINSSI